MAFFYPEPSRTFSEYLLLPNKTTKDCVPSNVRLTTPLVRHRGGEQAPLRLNVPMVSAIMQSVSNDDMAIALARMGGLSFIFSSQSIESQVEMVRRVKKFKAGFVVSDSNLRPDNTVADVLALRARSGHSTIPITSNGKGQGKLLGLVTSKDFRPHRTPQDTRVSAVMTPFEKLVCAREGQSLGEVNDLLWDHKLNAVPVINERNDLVFMVFRKDYDEHRENPCELIDREKRLMVGAGINSRDYKERVPALIEAGADVLCVDSSDGFNEWQFETIRYIKEHHGSDTYIGGGNIVDREGFRYLVDAGADFVKVGVGPGAICVTREQKGIGRGQATAVIDVAKAREEYLQESSNYVPICADGGIFQDYHIVLALAMGADVVMLGRYFARFDESPGRKLLVRGNFMKEYWGEGTNRARNWQRYHEGEMSSLPFEEGVDAYVPYAGRLKDNVELTLEKVRSTMCNCGSLTIRQLQQTARLTLVSSTSIREGGAHDVLLKDSDITPTV